MKTTRRIAAVSFIVILLLSILRTKTAAQENSDNTLDPPSRVARLSYLAGAVSFQPGGVDDWGTATLNRPLTTSDRLWTDRGARAELQTDRATMRLDGETSFTLANLDDNRVQIQLAAGVLNVKLRQIDPTETFEIDTPNFTINLLRAGEYRVQVDSDKDVSWVTVRSGSAEVTGGPQAVTVKPGEQVSVSGTNGGSYDVHAAPGPDSFDQWCIARDQRGENARSAQYVSRGVIGYEDLDEYGTWRNYDQYGQVWVPTVTAVDWAPYRNGHWAWIYPWGWTWVDDAPWGFAPFHYGRWIHAGFGWAWVPGSVYVRPVYAPALVAWCGGSGWSVGVSFGSGVGWFPLGPREPYIPWYWGSRHYFSRINITNTHIVNVNNYYNNYYYPRWRDHDGRRDHDRWNRPDRDNRTIAQIDYANRRAPNGMTFVDHDSFVKGRRISGVGMRVPQDKLRNAPVVFDNDFKPDRSSVLGGRIDNSKVHPPQRVFDRPFVSRVVPPKPIAFDRQTERFAQHLPPTRDNVQTRTFTNDGGRNVQTRTVTNDAGRPDSHLKPGPAFEATENRRDDHQQRSSAESDLRSNVPRPPAVTLGDRGNVSSRGDSGTRHIDFGPAADGTVPKPSDSKAYSGFGSRNPNQDAARFEPSADRPRWNVPKPPEGHVAADTSVREYRTGGREGMSQGEQGRGTKVQEGSRWGSNEERVHVDRGRTTSPAVVNPPQENRPVRSIEQPRTRVEMPQRTEAPSRMEAPQRVEPPRSDARRFEAPPRSERVVNSSQNAGRTEHNVQQSGGGGHKQGGHNPSDGNGRGGNQERRFR